MDSLHRLKTRHGLTRAQMTNLIRKHLLGPNSPVDDSPEAAAAIPMEGYGEAAFTSLRHHVVAALNVSEALTESDDPGGENIDGERITPAGDVTDNIAGRETNAAPEIESPSAESDVETEGLPDHCEDPFSACCDALIQHVVCWSNTGRFTVVGEQSDW